MERKYLKYNLEELVEDKQFIAWVLKGKRNNEWEKFFDNNPEIKTKAKKAREIILLLSDTFEVLDEESVLNIWQNIDQFEQLHKKKVRIIKLRKRFSWAASVLLVVSIGTLGFLNLNEKAKHYQFASSQMSVQSDDARLVLSDGEEIALTNDNSTIFINNNNELVIDDDSVIYLSKNEVESITKEKMNEVIIPYGKKSKLMLADGTKVWLNAGSKFAFPSKFSKKNREVHLEGEAYFEVVKAKNKPFIVKVGEIDIRVIGTHFDVSAYREENHIETILLEGSVAMSKPKSFGPGRNEVILKPYQKANFNKEKNTIEVFDEPNADTFIAWTEGCLQFSQESLQSIFNKLERYYNIKIEIPSNFPSSELISGKLDLKESFEEVMMVLSDVAKIDYRMNENIISINKKLKELPMR